MAPLIEAIENFLGWDKTTDAYLVGAGSLGHALIGYENFAACGMNIVAAFDVSDIKLGERIHGRIIHHLNDMPGMAKSAGVKVGVLTVPGHAAQMAANVMIASGIEGIWNFAPVKLDVPEHVLVENVELVSSLAVLSVSMNGKTK